MSQQQQMQGGLVGSSLSSTAAARWKELHGERSWEGLLRPALDADLRRTVIWYGEMAQATYDAFIHERVSPNAGLSRFCRARFFDGAMLPAHAGAYKVTRFLYATSSAPGHAAAFMVRGRGGHVSGGGGGCRESNWIGYVAVATEAGKAALGRRDIVVAWRGTVESLEWVDDLEFAMVAPRGILGDGCEDSLVHRGWLAMYTSTDPTSSHNKDSARDQVLREVRRLVETYKDEEEVSITVTGHSLGAALATLNAFDIAENGYNKAMRAATGATAAFPVAAFAFASPRVGGAGFKKRFAATSPLRLLRIRNARDIVPKYPALLYHDVGSELGIDTGASPYLKAPGNERVWHNLESYLHGVAGVPASGAPSSGFELLVERDVALLNKAYDALREEHGVPAAWWVPRRNKGMAKGGDGRWRLLDCEEGDDACCLHGE